MEKMIKKLLLVFLFTFLALGVQNGSFPAFAQTKTQITFPGALRDFQFISENTGWVMVENQLFLTEDSGSTWQDITPNLDGELRAALFLNERHGISIFSSFTGAYNQHILATTEDSGETWSFHEIVSYPDTSPYYQVEAVFPFFLDSQTGWVNLKIKTGSNFSLGKLFKTSDGGETWTSMDVPLGEPVYFVNEKLGFITGGAAGQAFYRTTDGGITWNPVPLTNVTSANLAEPYFLSDSQGYLPLFQNTADSTNLTIMETTDQGRTWQEGFSTTISIDQAFLAPTTSIENTLMVLSPDQILAYNYSTGEYQENARTTSQSLVKFQMTTVDQGWGLGSEFSCTDPNDFTTCINQTELLKTNDGGISWNSVQLPMVTVTVTTAAPNLEAEPQAAINLNDRTEWLVGQGFDKCEIATLSQLQVWKNNSPYSAVNLYIGGVSRACANSSLSIDFIQSLSEQGWRFIPTWVGHQAACTSFSNTMSYGTTVAYNQGRDNATDAARVAYKLGLKDQYSPGTVIYYDLEAFDTTNASCLAAAKAFINGWVEKLHEENITAGVYGSVCASGLDNFYTLANPPDVIWPARWTSNSYQSNIIPDNLPCVTNMWDNHQRILQYTGDHMETWGGTSIYDVDLNTIDGIVADISQYIGVPTQPLQNPSFESGALIPWQILQTSTACNAVITNNTDNVRTGSYALLINKNSSQTNCTGVFQTLSLTPAVGERYRFAVWVRSASSTALRSVRLSITGLGTSPETTSYKFSGIKDSWACIEVDHTITQSNLTGVQVGIQLENSDGVDLHVDDAHVSLNTGSLCPSILIPTNVEASYTAYLDQIVIKWDEVPGSTFYRILRAATPNDTPVRIGVSQTAEYIDTNLEINQSYTYWIQACTPNQCSSSSTYSIGATAPPRLLFSDGFEAGNLSFWSEVVNENALDVCSQNPILDTYSLCIDTVPNETKYVTHYLVAPTNEIDIRFWVDPNSASFNTIALLQGTEQGTGTALFRVNLRNQSGYQILFQVRDNNNNWINSAWYAIPDTPNLIQIKWNSTVVQYRSSVVDFSDTELWINNNLKETLDTGINFGQVIDKIQFGAVLPPTSGNASHTIYLDEIIYTGPRYLRPRLP